MRCLKVLTGSRLLELGNWDCVGGVEKQIGWRNAATKAFVVCIVSTCEPMSNAAHATKTHFMWNL